MSSSPVTQEGSTSFCPYWSWGALTRAAGHPFLASPRDMWRPWRRTLCLLLICFWLFLSVLPVITSIPFTCLSTLTSFWYFIDRWNYLHKILNKSEKRPLRASTLAQCSFPLPSFNRVDTAPAQSLVFPRSFSWKMPEAEGLWMGSTQTVAHTVV